MKDRLSKLITTKAEDILHASRVSFSLLPGYDRFPMVMSPKYPGLILADWLKDNMDQFNNKLNAHGAVLLRGFDIDAVDKFKNFISIFEAAPLEYRQRSSPRYEVAKNIYHSTTYPEDQSINMHSENSYALNWAMRIVFCCIQPAEEQGETPIADNRQVVDYLSAATKEKFLAKGVRYVRNMSPELGLSWEEVFQTKSKSDVEEECRNTGMEYKWAGENRLVLSWNNNAIYDHPVTHEQVWFNHSFFFNKYALDEEVLSSVESEDELPFNTYFGDGTPISKEEIEEIRGAFEKATIVFPWRRGDVLFLDNMLISHGRRPYKGDRKIIVSMF